MSSSDNSKKQKKVLKKKKAAPQQQIQQQPIDIFSIVEDTNEDLPSEMKPSVQGAHAEPEDVVPVKFKLGLDSISEDNKSSKGVSNKAIEPQKGDLKIGQKFQDDTSVPKRKSSLKQTPNYQVPQPNQPLIKQNVNQKPTPLAPAVKEDKSIKGDLSEKSNKTNQGKAGGKKNEKESEEGKEDDNEPEVNVLDDLQSKLLDREHEIISINKLLKSSKEECSELKKKFEDVKAERNQLRGLKDAAAFEKQIKILKEQEGKLKKELGEYRTKVTQMQSVVVNAKADASKHEKIYLGITDQIRSLEINVIMKDGQIKALNDKNTQMIQRNKDMELASIEVNKRSDRMYKEKLETESIKDQLQLQIDDLESLCDVIKKENKNLTEILVQRTKEANERMDDYMNTIQEQNKEISQLKKEKLEAEHREAAERSAKEELMIKLELLSVQVLENEELKKNLEKKGILIEELEDYVTQLKTKLRKFDTQVLVRDQQGQIKDYRDQKYTQLIDKKYSNETDRLKRELQTLTENMESFSIKHYKTESEKDTLLIEIKSLRAEVKRLEDMKGKDHNDYEHEINQKHSSLEELMKKLNNLTEENEQLKKIKITKLELLKDYEYSKMEEQHKNSQNRIESLEAMLDAANSKLESYTQIVAKEQLMLGDLRFRNANLKDEIEQLEYHKNNKNMPSLLLARDGKQEIQVQSPTIKEQNQNQQFSGGYQPLYNYQHHQVQQQQQQPMQQSDRLSHLNSQNYQQVHPQANNSNFKYQMPTSIPRPVESQEKIQSVIKNCYYFKSIKNHIFERPFEYHQVTSLNPPGHFERDQYANFYKETREIIDTQNKFQSSSSVASQSRWPAY